MANKEYTVLVDEYIDVPEELGEPKKLHILVDSNTREYADQYISALHVVRNVPFNTRAISVTDPLALVIASQQNITDGNKVVNMAEQYYEKWTQDIAQHGWILAILEDNEFVTIPSPYAAPKTPRGLTSIPQPRYDLSHTVEYRLKQIQDFLEQDLMFQAKVMSTINNSIAKLVADAGVEEKNKAGFQSGAVNGDVHANDVSDSDDKRNGSRGKKVKKESSDTSSVAKT